MMRKYVQGVAALWIAAVGLASAEEAVWRILESDETNHVYSNRVRKLQALDEKVAIEINFDALRTGVKGALSGSTLSGKNSGNSTSNSGSVMTFELPEGKRECNIMPSMVIPSNLAAKYPNLQTVSGICSDGSAVALNFVSDDPSSVAASFDDSTGDSYYVDNADGGSRYLVYRKSASIRAVNEHTEADSHGPMQCNVRWGNNQTSGSNETVPATFGRRLASKRVRGLQTSGKIKAFIFRLAMATNQFYAKYHGNTVESVMNAIVTMMTRVNGVYTRELGVYFQLVENNDKLICIDCNLPNDANGLLDANENFITGQGISSDQYDIGHIVSTGSGGMASYPGLCDINKAVGTTGTSSPINDPFWVDYVAHELGHQLLGAHSFRNCSGFSNIMMDGAVEPGSGSSIMGYAGICGQNNLQTRSDPYFNAVNLVKMRDYLEGQAAKTGCGKVEATSMEEPKVDIPITGCTVPVGNYVTLRGAATGPSGVNWAYSWDRVDVGTAQYQNKSVARFRSWKPTASAERTLPNMYYILKDMTLSQLDELLPLSSMDATFRFVARTQYNTAAQSASLNLGLVGAFDQADVKVSFDGSVQPMKISSSHTAIAGNSKFEVQWTPGGTAKLSPYVKIEAAVYNVSVVNKFDYEANNVVLQWESLGTFPNTGSANVVLPEFNEGSSFAVKVRSANDNCNFFDIAKDVRTLAPGPSPDVTPIGLKILFASFGSLVVVVFASSILYVRRRNMLKQEPRGVEPEQTLAPYWKQ